MVMLFYLHHKWCMAGPPVKHFVAQGEDRRESEPLDGLND